MANGLDTKALRKLLAQGTVEVMSDGPDQWTTGWTRSDIAEGLLESVASYAVAVLNAAPALLDAAEERDGLRARLDDANSRVADYAATARQAMANAENAEARVATLEGALRGMLTMADVALPQFNWSASALSARAIGMLNEAPIIARAALGGDRE